MSAITAKASRKMKKYAVLTREPRCFLGSFDFSWEQRKLGDIASDMVAGGDIDKDLILAEGQYPVIANALTGDGIVGYYDKEYRVNAPAVTVTGRGDVGHAKARLVNFTPVVRLLSVKSEHDVFFLENAINTLKIVIESTGVPQLTVPQLAKYEVAFPRQLDEEEHIGAFFKQLDHLITLHQRKCALLFSHFQALIYMMFTTSTFSWEQRKLGELALFNPKDELPQTFEYVDLESVVGTEMLSHRTEVKSSAPSRAQRLAHTGDLFYQTVRPYQKNNYLFEKPDNNYVFSTGYAQMRPYVDGYFLLSLLQSERFVKVVLDNCTGTSYPAINANDLAEIEVAAPSDESEAQRIGTIFRSIDNLITLHQRKCISFTGRAGRLISTVNKKRITSSWEQRKFSELVQIERGGSPRPIDDFITDTPNGLNWIKIGDAPTQGNYITKTAEKIRPEGLSKTREVHPGDLILSNSMSFGKPYIMGIDGCIHDGWLLIRNTYGVFDLTFLCHLLGTPQMLSQYRSLAAGSTVNNLNKELVGNTVVTIPSITEQRVLGDYLEQLDNLITLHQRKPFLMKWRNSDANRNQTNRLVL